MSNKQKTAVEYIIEELSIRFDIVSNNLPYIQDIVEKAKEIEKQQIIDTWNTRAKIDGIITFTDNRTAEQYYKETYEDTN